MRRFEIAVPESVKECLRVLAERGGEAKVIAGGTDLIPQMKVGLLHPRLVVDLSGIADLRALQANGGLRIGASVTARELELHPGVRSGYASLADGVCGKVRIALAAVAPTPVRALAAERALEGQPPTPELIERAANLAVEAANPISDQRGSADFRRHLVRVLTRRTLAKALERARG